MVSGFSSTRYAHTSPPGGNDWHEQCWFWHQAFWQDTRTEDKTNTSSSTSIPAAGYSLGPWFLIVRVKLDAISDSEKRRAMNEARTLKTELVDALPLVLAHMQHMGPVAWLESHVPTHSNRVGRSLGWVTAVWLTPLLSPADHRRNRVHV